MIQGLGGTIQRNSTKLQSRFTLALIEEQTQALRLCRQCWFDLAATGC
jgi:hypothetical protein